MKKLLQFTIILIAFSSLSSCGYNKIVELEETTNKQWGQVESAYQRRADLVPKLISQAKLIGGKYTKEIETAMKSAEVKLNSEDLQDSKKIQSYHEAQGEVGDLLTKYFSELQTNPGAAQTSQNITELKAQLEGAENRIGFERKKYNDAVSEFNAYIRKVPQNLTSGVMGFDEKAYFKAQEGAK